MEVSRNVIRISLVIFGILVLISYGIGFSRTDDPMALWGGLRENAWKFIVPFMLVAIIGFLIYWWTILITVDISVVKALRSQSFTSLMADLRQDNNRVSSFSRCLNGTFP